MIKNVITILCISFVITFFAISQCKGDSAQDNRNEYLNSIVIIRAGKSAGTGFICEIDGVKYLISNEHVMSGGSPFQARIIGGRRVKLSSFELSDDADLVRCRIKDDTLPALKLSNREAKMGEAVHVWGNSDGRSVVTCSDGKVVGLGNGLVEVDAEFVHGNSGSPILNNEGEVLAVATFATRSQDASDWVKKGTRFEQVRRFGLSLNGRKWVSCGWKSYCDIIQIQNEIEFALDNIRLIQDAEQWRIDSKKTLLFARVYSIRNGMSKVVKADEEVSMIVDELNGIRKERERVYYSSSSIIKLIDGSVFYESLYSDTGYARREALAYLNNLEKKELKKFSKAFPKCLSTRQEVLSALQRTIAQTNWPKGEIRDRAQLYLRCCEILKADFESLARDSQRQQKKAR